MYKNNTKSSSFSSASSSSGSSSNRNVSPQKGSRRYSQPIGPSSSSSMGPSGRRPSEMVGPGGGGGGMMKGGGTDVMGPPPSSSSSSSSSSGSNANNNSSSMPSAVEVTEVKGSRSKGRSKDVSDIPTYDRETRNPDGSLRTCHQMPGLDELFQRVRGTRYVRYPQPQSFEVELNNKQIFGKEPE